MNRNSNFALFGVVIIVLLFTFNNCSSNVEFAPSQTGSLDPVDTVANSGNQVLDNGDLTANTTTTTLTDTVVQDLITTLPTDEVDAFRPVTDLIDNPELFTVYKCPDSDGVVICHFPENVEAQSTQCIGHQAVDAHYDHIRSYSMNGETKVIQDYLGPCRAAL